jgi:hypothetical protein
VITCVPDIRTFSRSTLSWISNGDVDILCSYVVSLAGTLVLHEGDPYSAIHSENESLLDTMPLEYNLPLYGTCGKV